MPLRGVRFALRDCALAYAVTASGRPVDGFEQAPKGERVFRHAAEPYTFELDGKPLAPARACTVLRPDFNALYRETEPLDLAPGVHTLRIVTGEADQNFFLPAVFATGDFAVFNGLLVPRPRTAGVGTLDGMGLGTYPGALTYTATVTPPATPCCLRHDGRPGCAEREVGPQDVDAPAHARFRRRPPRPTHLGVVGARGYGHGSCADVATRRAPFGRGMVYYEENPMTNPFISPVRSVC